jgi:hypothetical protein
VLLILYLAAIFVALPLATEGLAIAWPVADTMVLAVLAIVVLLIATNQRPALCPADASVLAEG